MGIDPHHGLSDRNYHSNGESDEGGTERWGWGWEGSLYTVPLEMSPEQKFMAFFRGKEGSHWKFCHSKKTLWRFPGGKRAATGNFLMAENIVASDGKISWRFSGKNQQPQGRATQATVSLCEGQVISNPSESTMLVGW